MSAPLLQAAGLAAGYAGHSVLRDIDAAITAGRFVCLLGANGSGKSTLMRTLTGLQKPLAGTVRLLQRPLADVPMAERAKLLALVLTDRVSAPGMRGYDLVALGRQPHTAWSGRLGPRDHERIARALQDTASAAFAGRLVAELSDGERQRLLVARALAQEPRLLVLDEATAFLDLPHRVELMHLLRSIARTRELGVLLSTHDLELALRFADEVWLLDRSGAVLAGAPEDLVLSGSLQRAFQQQGLVFDIDRGTLHVPMQSRGGIAVVAQGHAGHWLKHAVHRAGFHVEAGSRTTIEVEGAGYRLRTGDRIVADVGTVGALVAAIDRQEELP